MTKAEHETIVMVLARAYQAIGALTNVLKREGLIKDDDLNAFHFDAWADEKQVMRHVTQARSDYLQAAKLSGVEGMPDM